MSSTLAAVPINQAWSHRVGVMERAISIFDHPITALEVGTWCGEGSTQIWMKNVQPGSSLTLVDPWKPYASKNDLNDDGFNYGEMDARTFEAYLSSILAVRRMEYDRKNDIDITVIRGDSRNVLTKIKDGLFDFIYIDGDHKYSSVKADIQEAKRLAKESFSIICGDDLEQMPSEELLNIASDNLDKDYIREIGYHPGVMLAVHEEFGAVNMYNGFWWIFKRNGQFVMEQS